MIYLTAAKPEAPQAEDKERSPIPQVPPATEPTKMEPEIPSVIPSVEKQLPLVEEPTIQSGRMISFVIMWVSHRLPSEVLAETRHR
jgi:hypothetical protein